MLGDWRVHKSKEIFEKMREEMTMLHKTIDCTALDAGLAYSVNQLLYLVIEELI